MAIATLTNKFHIVIHASGLQDYRNINRYHNLESKMNCIFLTDSINENSPYFESNEAFAIDKTNDDYQQDSMVEISRKNKQLAKRMVELKAKIHNNILDFYEVVSVEDADQEVLEGLYANMIPSEDMKLEVIAGLICKGIKISPHLDIPVSINYNSKFIILHEMIKFLQDFLSTSLLIKNNYYESLVEKTNDLSQFYKSSVVKKKDLHSKNYKITVEMLDYQDQIDKIDSQLEDIQASINNNLQRRKQQEELEKELSKVVYEKDKRINKIVGFIEQTTGADYEFILSNTKYGTQEDYLIKALGQIVNENISGFRSRQELEILFMNSNHLSKTLMSKKDREQDEDVFDNLKQFIIKYSASDFADRPLLKNLYKYLLEIYRKLNLRNSMASTFKKINDIKLQTGELEVAIYKRKTECEEKRDSLLQKFTGLKELLTDLESEISTTEISNVRSAQIINSITEISETAKLKLERTQERVKNILGDCIILACSVAYLGVFSMRKRIEFRQNMKQTLKSFSITSSSEWHSDDPEIHCQLFKEICEENGIHKMLNSTDDDKVDNLRACFINLNSSHVMTGNNDDEFKIDNSKAFTLNPVLSENIFYLLFGPTTPV
jgi:hypothetical protein